MNRLFCHVTCFSKSVRQLNIHRLNVKKKKIKKNKNRKLSTNNLFNINNDDNSSTCNKTNPSTNKTWHLPMGVKSINWKQNRLFYTEFTTFSTKLFKVCIVVFSLKQAFQINYFLTPHWVLTSVSPQRREVNMPFS